MWRRRIVGVALETREHHREIEVVEKPDEVDRVVIMASASACWGRCRDRRRQVRATRVVKGAQSQEVRSAASEQRRETRARWLDERERWCVKVLRSAVAAITTW